VQTTLQLFLQMASYRVEFYNLYITVPGFFHSKIYEIHPRMES
jgi:hypothetical protein